MHVCATKPALSLISFPTQKFPTPPSFLCSVPLPLPHYLLLEDGGLADSMRTWPAPSQHTTSSCNFQQAPGTSCWTLPAPLRNMCSTSTGFRQDWTEIGWISLSKYSFTSNTPVRFQHCEFWTPDNYWDPVQFVVSLEMMVVLQSILLYNGFFRRGSCTLP